MKGNQGSQADNMRVLEEGRKNLSAETGLRLHEILFLEKNYCKGAHINSSTNLYGEYGYEPEKSKWTPSGFASFMQLHPQVASAMYKMMDDDGDGTLDFDEFAKGYGLITRGDVKQRLNLLFKIFDLDESDTLDMAETRLMVRTILRSFHEAATNATGPGGAGIAAKSKLMRAKKESVGMSAEVVEKELSKRVDITVGNVFKVCDKNNDGEIDREEFLSCLESISDTDPTPKCPEIVKALDLFEGGSLRQWNALGKVR